MRLKNVPGAREAVEESRYTFETPEDKKGHWKEWFGNENPLHIEVGTGKGKFMMELAALHPEINYIGIEKYSSVLLRALQKQDELQLPNLCFIRMEAEDLEKVFARNEVDRIYLNFSDPWPKDRHHKRRLTSKEFLRRYNHILIPDGIVEFKTDNRGLFDFSLEEIPLAGWDLVACTYDLHQDPVMNDGNIMTEYETKFSEMGNPIHKLITRRQVEKASEAEKEYK